LLVYFLHLVSPSFLVVTHLSVIPAKAGIFLFNYWYAAPPEAGRRLGLLFARLACGWVGEAGNSASTGGQALRSKPACR